MLGLAFVLDICYLERAMQTAPCRAILVWAHEYPARLFMESIGREYSLVEWAHRNNPPKPVDRPRRRRAGGRP